ncbi:MAG: sensor domain-containing diguanylate cyclase [Burkholderiales bacterium]|nr:sensor domain-containing diguanylate cyclase [Burkholderiales bacterium]
MSNQLTVENVQLRRDLSLLLQQARRNEEIMRRHQRLDLQFIGASSFLELIETVFRTLPSSSDLDVVTLALLDPQYDIRRILAELRIPLSDFPHLLFFQEADEWGELREHLRKTELGVYSQQRHGAMFPEPITLPASVAIIPLIRNHQLIGALSLGSRDRSRFTGGMASDFIEHLASIVAICIENVINGERLKHIGLTDPLTGVNNRRYLERRMQEEIGRSRRQGASLSCLYIDIDFFKKINDSIGHQAGDEVLREVAARIKAELRLSDALGRFGGEEFIVLLVDAALPDAVMVAERIRAGVGETPIAISSGEQLNVTVSIGVAMLDSVVTAAEDLESIGQSFLARADQALYQAKADGRDRVVAAAD